MNTIQINLLETKQIAAYVNGYSYALEGGYHIVAGEANATQFQLVSVPEQYEKATFYVNMINSQHKMVKEKLSVSLNGKFILPVGMAIAGYGQLIFSCNFNGETVIWVPLKVKVWNTRADWEIDTLSIPQDTLKRLEEAEGRINKLEDELIHPTTTFSVFRVGKTDIYASEGENTLTLLAGDNITLEANEVDDSIKISATGGTAEYPPATEDTDGLMSAEDKKNLDDIVSVFGSEAGDPDLLVNTIREILEIFQNYPEGLNLQSELTNVKKTANSALQPRDVKIITEGGNVEITRTPKAASKEFEGASAGETITVELLIESDAEIELDSNNPAMVFFFAGKAETDMPILEVIKNDHSGEDGEVHFETTEYSEDGKNYVKVKATISWNSNIEIGGNRLAVEYYEVTKEPISSGDCSFPLVKGSKIRFHGFDTELLSDKELLVEGTRLRADGYSTFVSGDITLIGGRNIGISQAGKEITFIAADPPVTSVNDLVGDVKIGKKEVGLENVDNVKQYSSQNPPPYPVTSVNGQTGDVKIEIPTLPENIVTTDTEQTITGEKKFTNAVTIDGTAANLMVGSGEKGYLQIGSSTIAKGDPVAQQSHIYQFPNNGGTLALESDVQDAKDAAQTAQSAADSAKTAAQSAQSAANASLQPEDITIIAEQETPPDLRLPLKKGTRIYFHGFSADLVSDNALSIDGTRLKASETSQEPISGDITLKGDGIIRISQVAKEFVFSAYLPENHVTTDTEQTITGEKTFTEPLTVGDYNVSAIVIDSTGIQVCSDGTCSYLTLPKKFGTVATLDDIPTVPTNYVTINTTQKISGAKTFTNAVTIDGTAANLMVGSGEKGYLQIGSSTIAKGDPDAKQSYIYQFPDKGGMIALTEDIDTKIAEIVNSAPETLDTLAELAKALGDDPNFATTVANQIGGKVSKAGDTMTGDLKVGSSSIGTNGYIEGTWLRGTSTGHLGSAATKVAVLDGSGWVYYRTPSEILDDIEALPLAGGTLTSNAQIQRTGKNVLWEKGREGAVLSITSTEANQYSPIFSEKTVNGSWEFGSYNDETHLVYITDSDYIEGNNLRTADYKFPQNKSGTVALEEETVNPDDIQIYVNNPDESFTTKNLRGRVDLEFHGFDFGHEEAVLIDGKKFQLVTIDGTRITANGAPDGFISGDITFKGIGITIAQAGKEITFGAVAPTWDSIDDKPSWIGSSKPSYSWKEITGTENVALKSDIPSLLNYVTTNSDQTVNGNKTFSSGKIVLGNLNTYAITISTNQYATVIQRTSNGSTLGISIPFASGTMALTKDIPTDAQIFLKSHPIGSIYISYNSTSPGTLFGGSWTEIANGRFLMAAGSGGSSGSTGGSADAVLVDHQHIQQTTINGSVAPTAKQLRSSSREAYGYLANYSSFSEGYLANSDILATGGYTTSSPMATNGKGANNPPYYTVHIWRRTA